MAVIRLALIRSCVVLSECSTAFFVPLYLTFLLRGEVGLKFNESCVLRMNKKI